MKTQKVLFITQAAMIAALYVVLTFISNALGLASGVIQIRISEALTILPFFTTAAIPGLFIGCLISNLLTGCALFDILFGSLATLLGALGTYALRKWKWCSVLPPIMSNTILLPLILTYVYDIQEGIPYLMLTIGIGETISCGVLGLLLLSALSRYGKTLFPYS